MVLSFAYQAALVLAGNAVASRLRALPFARTLATRLAGIALVGLGQRGDSIPRVRTQQSGHALTRSVRERNTVASALTTCARVCY